MECTWTIEGKTFNSLTDLENYLKLHYKTQLNSIVGIKYSIEDLNTVLRENRDKVFNNRVKEINTKSNWLEEDGVRYDEKSKILSVSDAISHIQGVQGVDNDAHKNNRNKQLIADIKKNNANIADVKKHAEDLFEEELKKGERMRRYGKGLHMLIETIIRSKFLFSHEDILNMTKTNIQNMIDNHNPETNKDAILPLLDNISDESLKDVIKHFTNWYKNNTSDVKAKVWSEYEMEAEIQDLAQVLVNEEVKKTTIRGKADIVILKEDKDGVITSDVIDVKVSSKPYGEWDIDKQRVTNVQLAFYQRMLSTLGIPENRIDPKVLPLQLVENDKGEYEVRFSEYTTIPANISPSIKKDVNNLVKNDVKIEIDQKLIENVNKDLSDMFGLSTYNNKMLMTNVDDYIKNSKRITKSKDGTKYTLKSNSKKEGEEIKEYDNIEDLKQALLLEFDEKQTKTAKSVSHYRKNISQVLKEYNRPNNFDRNFSFNISDTEEHQTQNSFWNAHLLPFISEKGWRLDENPIYDEMGILMFRNDDNKQMYPISITNLDVHASVSIKGKNKNILAKFYDDDAVASQNQVVKATVGNLELMKILTIINNIPDYKKEGFKIVNILAMNPFRASATAPLIKDKLVKNFETANKKINKSNFNIPSFKDRYQHIHELLSQITKGDRLLAVRDSAKNMLKDPLKEHILTQDHRLKQLYAIKETLENNYEYNRDITRATNSNFQDYIYQQVILSILELSDTTLDYLNISNFSDWGLEYRNKREFGNGLQLNTLDTIPIVRPLYKLKESTDTVIRHRYSVYKRTDRSHTKKFYETNPMVANKLVNYKTQMFKDLLDPNYPNDLRVKDPSDPSLTNEQRDYLKFWLEDLNANRYPGETETDLRIAGKWHLVPLVYSKKTSKFATGGLKGVAKGITRDIKRAANNLANELDEEIRSFNPREKSNFQFSNSSILSDNLDRRKEILDNQKHGDPDFEFEINLEVVKDYYIKNKIMREEYNKILPVFSAAVANLKIGSFLYGIGNDQVATYISDIVNSTILNRRITDPEFDNVLAGVGVIKSFASMAILGLNYRSGIKETITSFINLYKHAVLNTRLDKDKLSIKDINFGYNYVWVDSVKQINKITLGEELNFVYGMANMDIDEIDTKQNFESQELFRNSSRMFWTVRAPDFLNRMTLLIGYLHKHGCLDAHSIDKETGQLKYDWKKDKRFDLYAKDRSGKSFSGEELIKWQHQRAMYLYRLETFVKERFVVTDYKTGETRVITMEDDLPLAFNTSESAAIRQESNTIFGYMDRGVKSNMFKKTMFILFGQFATYITARKNQYLLNRELHGQGKISHAKDLNGNLLYKQITYDQEGNEIGFETTTEITDFPLYTWEGRMMEGIWWSLKDCLNVANLFSEEGREKLSKAWADADKKRNVFLALEDLLISLLLMFIAQLIFGPRKDQNKLEKIGFKILNNASSDFDIINTFMGVAEFKIPAFDYLRSLGDDVTKAITGDMRFDYVILNNLGPTKFLFDK